MFRRRLVGYRQMGYRVEFPADDAVDTIATAKLM
jgi:hypothetical protein